MEYPIQPNWRSQPQKTEQPEFQPNRQFLSASAINPVQSIEPNKHSLNSLLIPPGLLKSSAQRRQYSYNQTVQWKHKKRKRCRSPRGNQPTLWSSLIPTKAIKQDAPKEHSEVSTLTGPERSNRSHESVKEATTSKLSGKVKCQVTILISLRSA